MTAKNPMPKSGHTSSGEAPRCPSCDRPSFTEADAARLAKLWNRCPTVHEQVTAVACPKSEQWHLDVRARGPVRTRIYRIGAPR